MRRRYLLEIIANAFKWLVHSFTYLYNSLVPTTIDGKSVKDKARIKKIYANGVIENQLVQNGNFVDTSGWETLNGTKSVSDNVLTQTLTTIGGHKYGNGLYKNNFITEIGHKYLCIGSVKPAHNGTCYIGVGYTQNISNDISITANQWNKIIAIITKSGSEYDRFTLAVDCTSNYQVGDTIEYKELMCIDLTLRFGTGNEPTSLSDNRIQKILNSGYIANNAGTYKGTDISEFSSEPYNLFDEELESGYIDASGLNQSNNKRIRSKNYIEVVGGRTYTLEEVSTFTFQDNYSMIVVQYDENKNVISRISSSNLSLRRSDYTLSQNARYVRFYTIYNSDVSDSISSIKFCFHLTGTRTGYAPHQTFSPLSFIYQGNGALNSHDTLERLDTEWVFTKNTVVDDLGTLNWTYDSGNGFFASDDLINKIVPPATTSDKVNAFINACTTLSYQEFLSQNKPDKAFYCSTAGKLRFTNASLNGDITLITGTLTYQLSTPQVIRIPKKHLGIVDLGSLGWVYQSDNQRFFTDDLSSLMKKITDNGELGNLYCSKYQTHIYNGSSGINNIIIQYVSSSINRVFVRDTQYNDATTFKNSLANQYLFYETENEVADIPFTLDIEAGGTITSDSDVLPNVDFDIKCK